MGLLEIIVIILVAFVVLGLPTAVIIGVIAYIRKRSAVEQTAGLTMLQQQLEALKGSIDQTKDAMQKSMQGNQTTLTQSLTASQKVLSELNHKIGDLQGTNKQMLQLGTDVKRLGEILSSPKLRGQMGEWSLENLLAQILPKDSYELQYGFKDGKIVDALIKMNEYSVSVDAKFPLPAFEAIVKEEDTEVKVKLRKQLVRDVFKHIDKIAGDYIRPAEGTLDFAIMYVPAENVYYETIVRYSGEDKDIMQYALDKKVVLVSPNLLYAYLMTIAMGLHGLQIEEKAGQIQQNLSKLNAGFAVFLSNYDTLGRHLRNAQGQYEEGDKKLNKFGLQLELIQGDDQEG